ncbi:MAG: peptide chain release factor N(5)-glutamine methyltransferase, partial [Clostridiales bacterium]|nr:peptide chain release factor N(5)-glutamine methyltransferase [Clostridiales bacterium]
VGEGVLIPRPDTEVLVDRAIQILKGSGDQPVIADLCSGSGCIAIAIKKNMPSVRVFAVERSPKAMHYLIKNKAKNNVDIEEVLADVCDESTLEDMPNLDMVVANPPYLNKDDIENLQREVAFEPREALYGSSDGLRFYREITAIWTRRIKHGGILMYEIGQGQHEEVLQIMLDNGIVDIEFEEDVNGIIRLIYGRINRK